MYARNAQFCRKTANEKNIFKNKNTERTSHFITFLQAINPKFFTLVLSIVPKNYPSYLTHHFGNITLSIHPPFFPAYSSSISNIHPFIYYSPLILHPTFSFLCINDKCIVYLGSDAGAGTRQGFSPAPGYSTRGSNRWTSTENSGIR